MDSAEARRRFELQSKIIDRAEEMGIIPPGMERWVCMLDIGYADKQFNLRLEEFLGAEEFDFCHDWFGIYRHMNRKTCKVEGHFIPRFAGD